MPASSLDGKQYDKDGNHKQNIIRKILHQHFGRVRKPNTSHHTEEISWLGFCYARTNQRRDFLHKKARYLVDHYDAIGIEDISVKAMAKYKKGGKFSFGKSVADNGWNMFTNMLEYKLAWQGKQLIKIDKWYPSSQLCHVCGFQNDATKDLSVREWDCPKCGSHHDRDKNAAINIREEARRISAA
ncbi:RNA-guided endonuclease TnpB family protein [Mitsuokella sp.]